MRRWFLSYNSQDLGLVQRLEAALRRKDPGAKIFFATKSLRAGGLWLPELAREIAVDRDDAVRNFEPVGWDAEVLRGQLDEHAANQCIAAQQVMLRRLAQSEIAVQRAQLGLDRRPLVRR